MTTTTTEYVTDLTGRLVQSPDGSRTTQDLREFFSLLDALVLECPSVEAVERWEHMRAMSAELARVREEQPMGLLTLARKMGRGEVSPKQADKQFAAVLTSSSQDYQRARVRLYMNAVQEAGRHCREALRQAGDLLLEAPRAAIAQALSEPKHVDSQARWDGSIKLLHLIHGFGVVRAEGGDHIFRRPDMASAWTRENGRPPTVRDVAAHADEWGPTVLTGAEVLEAAKVYAPKAVAKADPTEPPTRLANIW
jgi:hypothetical protein